LHEEYKETKDGNGIKDGLEDGNGLLDGSNDGCSDATLDGDSDG